MMQNMEKEEVEAYLRLNEQGRCANCKRRNDGMITCERCKEFIYCSIECLEDDRPMHKLACDVIGLKKGYLVLLPEEEVRRQKIVKEKARLLTEDGLIKTEETSLKRDQDGTRSDLSSGLKKSSKPKPGKNKTKKGGNGNRNKAGLHKNVDGSKDKDENKSTKSLVASGRFGGPVKVSSKQESGESFGEHWWKGKAEKLTKEQQKFTSKATSSGNTKAKLKFKDYYSDSEDEADEKEFKSNIQEGASSDSNSTFKSDETLKQTGMELMKYDPKKAEEELRRNQNRPAPGTCFYCKKEGTVLKCSRCKITTYCGKACQLGHYEEHKGICRLKDRFETAVGKISEILLLTLHFLGRPCKFSVFLDDILNPVAAMFLNLRNDVAVVVEIVAAHPHPILYGAIVRDATGRLTQVLFFGNTMIYQHVTDNVLCPTVNILLPLCLQPGNFMVLLKPKWSVLPGGKPGIRVDDLEDVHFVFMES